MPWREAVEPVRMERVAVVAPVSRLRDTLVQVADSGSVEVEGRTEEANQPAPVGSARHRVQQAGPEPGPAALAAVRPDLDVLDAAGRRDLLAGEAEVEQAAVAAVVRDEVAAVAGWAPAAAVPALAERLAPVGGAVVRLAPPRGTDPPTQLLEGGEVRRSLSPLVSTYATVPYADVDPTVLAGVAYVVMFGMMFGDAGHGLLVVLAGLLLRTGKPASLARFRRVWPFVVGAGVSATFFGLLYGEFFGPTGVVPVLWIEPLAEPVTLMVAALGMGAVLLAGAYVLGSLNRWREGGWPLALGAPSGIAGAALFAGLGIVLLGLLSGVTAVTAAGVLVAGVGLVLAFLGLLAAAPADATGGTGARVTQAVVELFDAVIRLATNLASFARLAAFGLTHAALGLVVWQATTALWGRGGVGMLAAVVVFVVGNTLAFGLEALVAAVQALRLEYYELFSRVFTAEGRAFRPWHVPLDPTYAPVARDPLAAATDLGRSP
jgi:V/A-type H+-transporting ATPase subunit I